jgi:MFS superfamily sulfate permease-like transporter
MACLIFLLLFQCVLSSIVVVALKGMFLQVKDLPVAWKQSPFDGMIWLTTFLAVVLLDIDYGLGLGVALSLLCVLIMGQRPQVCRLGQVPNTEIFLDVNRYQAVSNML